MAIVHKGKISDGTMTMSLALTEVNSADATITSSTFYDTDKVIVPVLDRSASIDYLKLYVLNK